MSKKKINITIDDAGSGNFVGGMLISGWAEPIKKYKGVTITTKKYNEYHNNYQEIVLDCVKEIVDYFSEYEIEYIFLCQSNLFDKTTDYFVDKGYVIARGKVEGELQDLIEDEFVYYLEELGLPKYIEFFSRVIARDKNAGYKMLNSFCINYIKADKDNRLKLCKKFNKLYNDIERSVVTKNIIKNNFKGKKKLCCNCGKYIKDDKLIKFTTAGRYNVFYAHISCVDN